MSLVSSRLDLSSMPIFGRASARRPMLVTVAVGAATSLTIEVCRHFFLRATPGQPTSSQTLLELISAC